MKKTYVTMPNNILKYLITSTALLALLLNMGCSKEVVVNTPLPYMQASNLLLIEPQKQYQSSRQYLGKIQTKQLTELSFEYGGSINALLQESGETVHQGQLLAEQDATLLLIKSKEIDAKIAKAEAQLQLTQANLVREISLRDKKYNSQQKLDELNAAEKSFKADKQALMSAQQALNFQINKTKLIAPFDAIIAKRNANQGETVSAGQSIFTLIKQGQNEIISGVPAQVANSLKIGDHYEASIGREQITLTLLSIGQQVSKATRTVELRFSLEQYQPFYNDQMATITIMQTNELDGFWVPLSSLIDGIRGQWNLYTVNQSNDAFYIIEPKTVTVLYSNQQQAFITGLSAKPQEIIADGVQRYAPGQRVRKANSTADNTVLFSARSIDK